MIQTMRRLRQRLTGEAKQLRDAELWDDFQAGMNMLELSEKHNIKEITVRTIIRQQQDDTDRLIEL